MQKLYLVDVSSMFFRAFYAIRLLNSPAGVPVNAIYGFVSMTVKMLREMKPDYMVFCFDRPEPSFRIEIDPNYKANRTEMPPDLVPQIPYIRKFADALGVPCFEKEKFEADDIIGTLAEFGKSNKMHVYIVSGDKDFGQLVGPLVTILDPMKDIEYDSVGVREKWGVEPGQMRDYLALIGDTSDNIPGVRGIGPKGAQKLLAQFGSLENIYQNISNIEGASLSTKLREGKESAFMSQRLVTIERHVPLELSAENLRLRPFKREALSALLSELNFKALAKTLLGEAPTSSSEASSSNRVDSDTSVAEVSASSSSNLLRTKISWKSHRSTKDWRELANWLKDHSQIWLVSDERAVVLAGGGGENWDLLEVLISDRTEMVRGFAEFSGEISGYDIKSAARKWGFTFSRVAWDHLLAAYVIRSGEVESFPELVKKNLGRALSEFPSANDLLEIHLQLQDMFVRKVKMIECESVLYEIEFPLISILAEMEQTGIRLDSTLLEKESKTLASDLRKLENGIFAFSKTPFNIGSPKQLQQFLFVELGLPPTKKTKTGFSTDSDVLESLRSQHKVIEMLLQYRELSKLKSTYVDTLPHQVGIDGRLHTHFNQALTATGRLSSTNPNLQNIPIRSERGNAIRSAFVADAGCLLATADYSQIELRILAHISGDAGLVRAFSRDEDVHLATASEVFSVPPGEVTSDMRRQAKAINFGLAYGQGIFGLAETLGVERKQASEIIERYFNKFPAVRDYMTDIVETAKRQGYVQSIFGRRRYLDELHSRNNAVKKFGERAAINAPMQTTASDIVKKAMIEVRRRYCDSSCRMLLQVHDELVFEVCSEEVGEQIKKISRAMESVADLKVPLRVNSGVGPDWNSAHS